MVPPDTPCKEAEVGNRDPKAPGWPDAKTGLPLAVVLAPKGLKPGHDRGAGVLRDHVMCPSGRPRHLADRGHVDNELVLAIQSQERVAGVIVKGGDAAAASFDGLYR